MNSTISNRLRREVGRLGGWRGCGFRLFVMLQWMRRSQKVFFQKEAHYGIPVDMGIATALSVEEYLHTSFPDLDREYRDGEIVERALPDYLHGKTQCLLSAFFLTLGKLLSLHPCVETRMRVRSNRYLIPDVAVFHPKEPDGVPETPPLVAIEIPSPDERLSEVREKLEEYRVWGVPHVWLVDPQSHRFYTCDAGLTEAASLTVPELGIEVTQHDLFK